MPEWKFFSWNKCFVIQSTVLIILDPMSFVVSLFYYNHCRHDTVIVMYTNRFKGNFSGKPQVGSWPLDSHSKSSLFWASLWNRQKLFIAPMTIPSSLLCMFWLFSSLSLHRSYSITSSLHSTCPQHLNPTFIITKLTGSNPSNSLSSFYRQLQTFVRYWTKFKYPSCQVSTTNITCFM